jgi:hypothetical protein
MSIRCQFSDLFSSLVHSVRSLSKYVNSKYSGHYNRHIRYPILTRRFLTLTPLPFSGRQAHWIGTGVGHLVACAERSCSPAEASALRVQEEPDPLANVASSYSLQCRILDVPGSVVDPMTDDLLALGALSARLILSSSVFSQTS